MGATVIFPMTLLTLFYVAVNLLVWVSVRNKKMTMGTRVTIGIFYGLLSILATHFGVDYGSMILNVRDLAPMSAGLLFDPLSGIIAGIIGGVERYIAGTYWGIGSFTRLACSISTCLAGFLAAFLNIYIFKGKRPPALYAMWMGALIEAFHMYVVLITHRNNMEMATYVVHSCTAPMIIFNSLGLGATMLFIATIEGKGLRDLRSRKEEDIPVSSIFQKWLFVVTVTVLIINSGFDYMIQTNAARQTAQNTMTQIGEDIAEAYKNRDADSNGSGVIFQNIGSFGEYYIISKSGDTVSLAGDDDAVLPDYVRKIAASHSTGGFFTADVYKIKMLCMIRTLDENVELVLLIPELEVYKERDEKLYESILSDIVIFGVIYILITLLVRIIVVDKLYKVNSSLRKITGGDLDETVSVYSSYEFASLSHDINQTVDALKGYIKAAEQRIEQELILARTIQLSALPKIFDFRHKEFDIYASMDPAREVGGDFYDFFFVDADKLALVIADVSGKGIPAALLMMRAKTTIRSLAETGNSPADVMKRTNRELCENNDAGMFVTVWIGVIDLLTGNMECVNAGHEYPAVKPAGGEYELFRRKHHPPLGVMEDIRYTSYEVKLDPGDCLFVYTDGIPEATDSNEEQYGTSRMLKALNDSRYFSQKDMLDAVRADVERFAGDTEQFDDMTMIGIRYNGKRS